VLDRFPGILAVLRRYDWPGNVRELRNVVERLDLLPLHEALPGAAPPARPKGRPALKLAEARDRVLAQFEREYLEDLLRHTRGNVTRAAELAGLSRRYFTQLMMKHGVVRKAATRARDGDSA
jgi:DNA-binding NtrC family response regulator